MKKYIFSIIVPTYNSVNSIKSTLFSITNQTFKHSSFEIIIVDDCSSDNTFKFIKLLKDTKLKKFNIRLYKLKQNSGRPAVPRNYGINKAQGEYIAFCDSDDIWHPQKLDIQYNFIKNKNSDNHAIYSSTSDFVDDGNISYSNISKNINIKKTCFFIQRLKNTIKLSSLVVNKNLFYKHGFFDENKKLTAVEDYELCLRFLDQDKVNFYKVKEFLVFYRMSTSSLSTNKSKMVKRVFFVQSIFSNHNKIFKYFEIYFYMISYFILSIYYRVILRKS